MGEHAYPDTQPPGSHLDPRCNIQKYTMDQLTAYWAMVYTLALIAGIAGDEDERKAARDAVKQALSDAAETVGDYGKAAQIVVDDYMPANPLTLPYTSEGSWVREQIGRGIESFFGFDTKDNDQRIEALDQQIRDKTAVQVNRAAGVSRTVKGVFGWDTSAEDAAIAQTQQTVNARNAEVSAAFDRLWNGIQEIALSRYNQFTKERDACGVGYALQTLGVDAGFVVVETVVTVAVGAVTAGAGAVALRISVHAGKTVGKIVVKISRAGRIARRVTPNEGTLRLEESKVVEFGKKHNGYGDDQGGHPIIKADQEPGGPNAGQPAQSTPQPANQNRPSAQRMRSREELLPDGSVPSVRNGAFNRWFDDLTPDELDSLWKDTAIRDTIEDRIRQPGGLHEWYMVSRAPTFKRWGVTMDEIKDLRTKTSDTGGVNPPWRHGKEGSTTAHNELLEIIDSSTNRDDFLRRLNNWANYRLTNGVQGLPQGLQLPQ